MSAPPIPYPGPHDGVGLSEYVIAGTIDLLRQSGYDSCANVLADVGNERDEMRSKLSGLRALVQHQADDEGLWFQAATAPEAYQQQELRKLHKAIELATGGETGSKG